MTQTTSPPPPSSATPPIDVSILIVTWNSEPWIATCLDGLEGACDGVPFEVIVVDNASADRSAEIAAPRIGTRGRLIRNAVNEGFAAGVNRAADAATGRLLLLCNPDCSAEPGSIRNLVEWLDEHRDIAAAAPLLIDEDGTPQREFQLRRLPTLASVSADLLFLDEILPRNRITGRNRYRELDLNRPAEIEQPAAAALLVRRDVFDRLGGLDTRFFPAWFEDVDFCRRLADAGHRIALVTSARVIHHGGSSLTSMPWGGFVDAWSRNLYRYGLKWFSREDLEILRWLIIAGMLLRAVAVSLGVARPRGGRWSDARAYLDSARAAFDRWTEPSRSY